MKKSALLLMLAAALAQAAIDGTVINGTTGKPLPGASVTMLKLGEAGMSPLDTVQSDAQGKFRSEQAAQGPVLLQVTFQGVTYNHMVTPGSPTAGLTIEVFDSAPKPGSARVAQDMLLLEPSDSQLFVTENVIFQNGGKLSFHDPNGGTLRVFVPEAAKGEVRVTITPPGGMPLQRTAEKTDEANIYKIDFPIRPGETRFDISYALPFSSPGSFSGRVVQKDSPLRLVVPAGVSVTGDGLEPLGQEPHTQAAIYGVKGREYAVNIQGTGTLRAAQEAAEEDAGPTIEQILPKMYDRVYWIVGLGLAILLLGFILLYRAGAGVQAASRPAVPANPKGKRS